METKSEQNLRMLLEGFAYLCSVDPERKIISYKNPDGQAMHRMIVRNEPLTDLEIAGEFARQGYRGIALGEAYNSRGQHVPSMRAIYVRRQK